MKIESIDKLVDSVSGFLETKVELAKLEIREELIGYVIKTVMLVMILLLVTFVIFFAGIGASFWLNEIFASNYIGWLIVGGLLLLKIISILLLRFTKSGNNFLKKIVEFLLNN